MLFVVFIALVVIGIGLYHVYDNCDCDEWVEVLSMIVTAIGGACILISLVGFGINYIGADSDVAANTARYDSLVYQYENNIYENDNDVGKKELIREIQDWNEDLARYKVLQNDFWVGIYIPDIYDQFKFIELE